MSEHGTASGIMFKAPDGKILLLQRGNGGDYPGHWAFPGGHIESGETAEEAARREVMEEAGLMYAGPLARLAVTENNYFTTFGALIPEQFAATLNDESAGWGWYDPDLLPHPMHPQCLEFIGSPAFKRFGLDETQIACLMRDGVLDSPQQMTNMTLWALRITGTDTAYRTRGDEYVYRPPELYLNEHFLKRCNGLPVIFEHPEQGDLDSQEYSERSVGTIMLPYVQGSEVWGIARIYDDATNTLMENQQMSTSPTVVFSKLDGNKEIALDGDSTLLIEGKPSLLDHLAICYNGVWDKGQAPAGVKSDNLESNMAEKENDVKDVKDDAEAPAWAKAIADSVSALGARMDSLELRGKEEVEKKADTGDMPEDPIPPAADSKKADDDEEKEKKADSQKISALEKEVASLKSLIPRVQTDADRDMIAKAQHRAGVIADAFGERVSAPIAGESPMAYRKRLAASFQPRSAQMKGVDVSALDGAAFDAIENIIYADAAAASHHAHDIPAGKLVEVVQQDATGRKITTFKGDAEVAWAGFKLQGRRVANIVKH